MFSMNPTITKEKILEAERTLIKYRNAKASLEARLIDNEEWYRLRRGDSALHKNPEEISATSAWLLNSIAGETMALAKPVIGTSVPAPAKRAMGANQPSAVSAAAMRMRVTDAAPRALVSSSPNPSE